MLMLCCIARKLAHHCVPTKETEVAPWVLSPLLFLTFPISLSLPREDWGCVMSPRHCGGGRSAV